MTVYIAGKCGDSQPDELIDQLATCFESLGYHLLDWRTLPVSKPYLEPSTSNAHSAEKMLEWAYKADAFVLIGHGQNYMAHIELGGAIAGLKAKPEKTVLVLLEAGVRESLAYCHPGVILVRSIGQLIEQLRLIAEKQKVEHSQFQRNLDFLAGLYNQPMKAVEQKDRQSRQ